MTKVHERLKELGYELPNIIPPVHSYDAFTIGQETTVYLSGQTPKRDGKTVSFGKVGRDLDLAEAQDAARLAALNLLAQIDAAVGLDNVKQLLKLNAFVSSAEDFTEQPLVANAASDLLKEVLGDSGRHARTAVSCPVLPGNASVELDLVFEIVK